MPSARYCEIDVKRNIEMLFVDKILYLLLYDHSKIILLDTNYPRIFNSAS